MEHYAQSNAVPNQQELRLLQGAVYTAWKELEALMDQNIRAEAEQDQIISKVEGLTQVLVTARKFQEAQDLYIATITSLSSEFQPQPLFHKTASTIEQRVAALHHFPIEETKRRDELSAQINALETEIELHGLTLQIAQYSTKSRVELITTLQGGISRLMRSCYPSRRLPPEIWANVFQIRVSGDIDDYLKEPIESFSHTALTLSHVCRSWMSLTTNTPGIWRDIQVHSHNEWTKGRAKLFEHYLSRSNKSSLEFYAEMGNDSRDAERNAASFFFLSLNPQLPYTQFLNFRSLDITDNYRIHFIKRLITTTTPDLSYIIPTPKSISVHNLIGAYLAGSQVSELMKSHSVSQVAIHGSYHTIRDTISYHILTHLTLDTSDRISSAGLAPCLKSIVELRLMNDEFTVHPNPERITDLPNLHVLGITPSHQQILRLLELPALQTVILYPTSRSVHLSEESLDSFASLTSKATNLHFYGWSNTSYDCIPSYSTAAFTVEMCKRSTRFTSIKFFRSFVGGSFLCKHRAVLGKRRTGTNVALEEIELVHCTGLTRDECEQLSAVVGRIKVFL
ncbi:hypothetical protein FRC17_009019 [Serendipita sp. 399]|nr:hypothetical protein FRC17_009019 [Serendipita sp. 399]